MEGLRVERLGMSAAHLLASLGAGERKPCSDKSDEAIT
jgi:hypothetical protein